ncbi:Serine proteinase stubble [Gryllus bimaculatus]|nr:Serine proteinase stubble [Gryllus bimaculatus]
MYDDKTRIEMQTSGAKTSTHILPKDAAPSIHVKLPGAPATPSQTPLISPRYAIRGCNLGPMAVQSRKAERGYAAGPEASRAGRSSEGAENELRLGPITGSCHVFKTKQPRRPLSRLHIDVNRGMRLRTCCHHFDARRLPNRRSAGGAGAFCRAGQRTRIRGQTARTRSNAALRGRSRKRRRFGEDNSSTSTEPSKTICGINGTMVEIELAAGIRALTAWGPWPVAAAAAAPLDAAESRAGRQLGWPGLLPIGPCFSSKGELGRCTSFRQCYPYFKLPELSNWETWVLGICSACAAPTPQRRARPSTPRRPPPCGAPEQPLRKAKPVGPGRESHPAQLAPPPPHAPSHNTHPFAATHTSLPGGPASRPPPRTPPHGAHAAPRPPTPPQRPPTPRSRPPNRHAAPWPARAHAPAAGPDHHHPPALAAAPVAAHPPHTAHHAHHTQAPDEPSNVLADASCGARNGAMEQERIVGGQNADIGEWPWMAALFNGGRQFCGGSLIDNIHILTAAHCVAHMSSWDVARLTVHLGDHNIKTNYEVRHIVKKVKRVVRHRGFDSRTLYNDVAVLTLDSPVTFTQQVRPVCLPSGNALYAGQTATVIGWGSLRESGRQPEILQEVSIPIWTNSECRAKYGSAAPGGIVEHFLCAGYDGKDSCSGDSGGPLMINNGRWTQVGIVSWGIGCGKGQYPGVYTRVTHFMPWITKNLK